MDGGRVPASEPPRLPSSRLSRLRQASSPSSGNSRLNRSFDAATTHASGYDVEDLAAQREELQQLSRQLEAMLAGGSGGEIFGNQASAQEGGAADALVEQEDEEEQQEEDDEYSDDEHHEDDDEDEDEDGDDEEDDDDEEQEEEEEEEEEIGDDDSNKENENNADGDDDDEEEEQPDEEQGDADDDDEDAAFSMQELAFLPDAVVEQLPDDLRETVRDVKMQYERLAEKQQQLQELQQQLQLLQSLRGEPASGDDDVGQALMAMQGLLGLQGMTGDREDVDEEDAAAAAADDDDDDDGQGGDKNDGDQHQHQQQLFGLGREQLAQVLPMLGVDLDQMAMLQHALGMPTGDDDNDNNDENDGNDENDETNDTDEQQQQQHDGGDAATQPSLDNIEESVVAASELARTLPQSSTQRAELDRLLQELHETRRMRQQLLQLRSLQEQQQQQQQQGSGGDEEDEDAAGEGATGQEGAQSGGAPVRSNANDSLNLNRAQQHRRGQPQQQGGDDGDEEETVDDVVESRRVAEARRELEAKRARLAELQAFRDRLIQEEQQLQQNSAAQEQYRELQEQQQQLADLRTQLAALKEQRAALLEQKRQRMLAAQQQQDEAESDGEDEAEEDGAQQQRQRRQQQQEGVDDGDEEEEEEDEEEDEVTEESREALAQQLSQELQRHQQLLAMLRAQKEGLRALRFGQAEQGTGEDEDEDERDEDEEDEQGSASAGGSGINSRIDALLGRVEQLRAMGHGVIREAQELRQRRQRSAAYHDGIEEVPEEEEDADDDDDEDVQQQQQEQQRQRRQRRGLMGMEIGPREDELSGLRQAEIDEVLRNLDHEKGYLLPGRISPRSGSVSLAPALGATTEPSVAAEMSTTMAGEGEGDDDGADAQADAAEWQLEQDIMMDELDELHRLEEQYRNTIEAAMEQGDQNADFVIRQRGLMDNLNRMRERVLLLRQQLGEQRTRGSADAEYWQDDEEDDDDYNTARDAMARAVSGAEYRQHQRELQQRGGMYGREGLSDVYERIAEYNDDMRMDGSGGGGVDDDDDVVEDEEEDHRMDQVSNAAYAQTREDIEIRRSEEAHNFQMALAYASILEPTERHEFLSLFFSRLMEGPFGAFVEAAQSYSLILANLDVRSDGEVHTAVSRAARRHHQQHQQQQQHQYQAPAQAWPNMWSGYPAMSPARMGLHTPAGGRGLEASNAGTVPSTAAAKPNVSRRR
ncbi:hypothetical protein PTSG_08833 [Salpingoeca rosetta]|uniref:Uncharacterized protein n=1 Tax=Salpingoeca rosetta (strain ATCC 50818 / BSB-021) TaxID=946362 RepID=F2UKU5_SALR5|nr:uncharacterized protein PTSG_08833 [Salpingoeca rosetta]EGD77744.1 hypothetical protein PTSG_08833 [Salpingoeca rosetta]|eukprot:XP_004990220.1 hypothetical protein PTSG_08833 [Salpingoeca rosetta]